LGVNMTNRLMFLWENNRVAWRALFPRDAEREKQTEREPVS